MNKRGKRGIDLKGGLRYWRVFLVFGLFGLIIGYLLCLALFDVPLTWNSEHEWDKSCLAGDCGFSIDAKTNLIERGIWSNGETFEKWATQTENGRGKRDVLLYAQVENGRFGIVAEYDDTVWGRPYLVNFNYDSARLDLGLDAEKKSDSTKGSELMKISRNEANAAEITTVVRLPRGFELVTEGSSDYIVEEEPLEEDCWYDQFNMIQGSKDILCGRS